MSCTRGVNISSAHNLLNSKADLISLLSVSSKLPLCSDSSISILISSGVITSGVENEKILDNSFFHWVKIKFKGDKIMIKSLAREAPISRVPL